MKQRLTRSFASLLVAGTLLGTSCAGSYSAIHPDRVGSYQSSPVAAAPAPPLQFSYQYDALNLRGRNKKYVKKERKKGYHVVAVRVTNNTSSEVNFSRDAVLYYGDRPITPVSNTLAAKDMKQGVLIYLLYVLLNPTFATTNGYSTNSNTFYIGPFIAGGNMLGAGLANQHFRAEMETFDLTDRNIRPGETVYGIISLRETNVAPLRLELRTVASTSPASAPLPAAPLPGGGGR